MTKRRKWYSIRRADLPVYAFTDINPGEESGINLAQKARDVFPSFPIFIISGTDYSELDHISKKRLDDIKVLAYTTKPFHIAPYMKFIQDTLTKFYGQGKVVNSTAKDSEKSGLSKSHIRL